MTPAPGGHFPGEAGDIEACVRAGRNDHRRQRLARDRRRFGGAADERGAGESGGPQAARVHRGHGLRRHPPERGPAHGAGHHGAPVCSSARALQLAEIDLLEIHEAFAAQVLANVAAWERGWKGRATSAVDWERVNVNGSSVAIGHPWSATGGRILTTLAYEMARREARRGLVSICAAGGMAGAFLLSRA